LSSLGANDAVLDPARPLFDNASPFAREDDSSRGKRARNDALSARNDALSARNDALSGSQRRALGS
jgi:hypothetical protein